ncbi:MAG: hypothetical protein LBM67_06880 [Lentimicrobiaceae bacterium]|jgi:hypothetical protein|nr:hypothetical protein [Lentimicrobiaceae bacterium]
MNKMVRQQAGASKHCISGKVFCFLFDSGHTPHREKQEETIKKIVKRIKNLSF